MSIIKVIDVCKIYGKESNLKVEALKNISFSVEKGEFVCIIGASGSGKSTLLHLLAGVDEVTNGKIIVNGQDITQLNQTDLAEYRRTDVGIVYQFFNLVPVLTAKENIELPYMLGGQKVDEHYFQTITDMLGISHRLSFYPSQLSGGEQQRVAIARALVSKPSIILADEPTGNLNSNLAKEIMEYLVTASKKLHQTIIMITHDMNLAKYANRIIEIKDGRIVSDSKSELLDQFVFKDSKKRIKIPQEGYDEKSGHYVIHLEKWQDAISDLYRLDQHSLKTLNKHASMTKEMSNYCQLLKQSLEGLKRGGYLLFLSIEENDVSYAFKFCEEFYEYIEHLDEMTPPRKRQILKYLKQ